MSKQYAHLHTMAKTTVMFQNDWPKTVGGVAPHKTPAVNCWRTDKQTNGLIMACLYRPANAVVKKMLDYSNDTHFSLNYDIHVAFISTFPPSLMSCILNVVDWHLTWCQNTSMWLKCSHTLHRMIALEKYSRLGGNISLEEINLLRPEVIIAFNLLRTRDISLLCM